MEKYLQYYYNISGINIYDNDNSYKFELGNDKYIFFPYCGDIKYLNEVFDFNNDIIRQGVACNHIVLTKDNMLFVVANNKNYVLIKYKKEYERKITLNDILNFKYYVHDNKFNCSNWKNLWETKINYFEYQLNQFGYKHPILRESFGYYSGYVELAIQLLNGLKVDNTYLAHRRIKKDYTLYNLFDPFNLIIDNRVRDIAEYYKSIMFEEYSFDNLVKNIAVIGFNDYEYQLFFVRMLYPTFYFDRYEKIMNNSLNDEMIKPIIKKTLQYEQYIKKLYNYIKTVSSLPIIEWLEN